MLNKEERMARAKDMLAIQMKLGTSKKIMIISPTKEDADNFISYTLKRHPELIGELSREKQ